MNLQINIIGLDYRHEPEFVIDRPNGWPEYVFVHFFSPVEFKTDDEFVAYPSGSCVFLEPDQPHWYRGYQQGLGNNWFHGEGAGIRNLVQKYDIPLNVPFSLGDSQIVGDQMRVLYREWLGPDSPTKQRAIELQFELMLLSMKRYLVTKNERKRVSSHNRLRDAFHQLRLRFREHLQEEWTVELMAREVNLSVSRFANLYREYFGISPIEDLIETRIRMARWLLEHSNASVGEIAERCGFGNIYYFSRLFKQRIGQSPTEYRKDSN